MKLALLIDSYVSFKRNIGLRFGAESRALRAFSKALGDVDVIEVEKQQVVNFINGQGPLTTYWHRKFEALTGFYRFAIARGHVAENPLPTIIPRRPKAFIPYIYSTDEIRRLIAGAEKVCAHPSCPMDGYTLQTIVLLLWGTGLRLSEALHLATTDVDFSNAVLTIRNTKFFKSRLVPIDPQLAKKLKGYAKTRKQRPAGNNDVSFFFATRKGAMLSRTSVERYFRTLCVSVGVARHDGARYQPRLHDLRHAFATNRVLSWYQEGVDVQHLLPSLSTYLGHGTLAATQRYLSATAEVLREASDLFEKYAKEEPHE